LAPAADAANLRRIPEPGALLRLKFEFKFLDLREVGLD